MQTMLVVRGNAATYLRAEQYTAGGGAVCENVTAELCSQHVSAEQRVLLVLAGTAGRKPVEWHRQPVLGSLLG